MDQIGHHQDTVIHAATGSGKTLGYLVPLLSRLEPGLPLQLLIVLPSRELALQVALDVHRLVADEASVNVALVVGGIGGDDAQGAALQTQRELASEVKARRAEVLIATPHALKRVLHTGGVKPSPLGRPAPPAWANPAHEVPPWQLTAEQRAVVFRKGWASPEAERIGASSAQRRTDHTSATLDGAKLLLTLANNLDALVLDEVDALLPKPLLSDLPYYRRRDWHKAGREERSAVRPGRSRSSPAAKLVSRLLRHVAEVRTANDGSVGAAAAAWRQRRGRGAPSKATSRPVQMVAASATVSRGTLQQLQALFGREAPPTVVGLDGNVQLPWTTPKKQRPAVPSAKEAFKQQQRERSMDAFVDQVVDGHLDRVRRSARGDESAAGTYTATREGDGRPTARGVAGVRVPFNIEHRYITVPDEDSKAAALVSALTHLKPRNVLAILPDYAGVSAAAWLERLRAEGFADASLLHEAMGFPTRAQQADTVSPRRTADLLSELSHMRASASAGEAPLQRDGGEVSLAPLPRLLLTTAASARGIDLPNLDCVALLFCPLTSDSYLHLAGRTGRAFNGGVALSVLSREEQRRLGLFTSQLGVKIKQWRA